MRSYTQSENWRQHLDMRYGPVIGEEENNLLMAPFEQLEIPESIKACASDSTRARWFYHVILQSLVNAVISLELVATV